MTILPRWILPIAFVAVGIAILAGWMLPQLQGYSGLRLVLGIVAFEEVEHGVAWYGAAEPPIRRTVGATR